MTSNSLPRRIGRGRDIYDSNGCVFVDVDSAEHKERRRKMVEWAKNYQNAARELMASFAHLNDVNDQS
jgi:hypothetical protein